MTEVEQEVHEEVGFVDEVEAENLNQGKPITMVKVLKILSKEIQSKHTTTIREVINQMCNTTIVKSMAM